jgi:hypothetical protein
MGWAGLEGVVFSFTIVVMCILHVFFHFESLPPLGERTFVNSTSKVASHALARLRSNVNFGTVQCSLTSRPIALVGCGIFGASGCTSVQWWSPKRPWESIYM